LKQYTLEENAKMCKDLEKATPEHLEKIVNCLLNMSKEEFNFRFKNVIEHNRSSKE
jgi:hypothetical protein